MDAPSSFLDFPAVPVDGLRPCATIFGVSHGSTYPGKDSSGYASASNAIRLASQEDAPLVNNWDFDLDGPLFGGRPLACLDIGNLHTSMHDNAANRSLIEATTRKTLKAPAIPILIGGDDSVPIPFFAAFSDKGPIWILQIDAHLDWRDEVDGERLGYSSPMRRASEMPHIAGIVQAGMRSVGSAGAAELDAARTYGSRIVTAREIHAQGVEAILRHIPAGADVVITVDCDGLDPGIMPGVAARTPGGLTYTQVIDTIAGVGKRARIAGFDLVELYPPNDVSGVSALTAARIVVNAIGAIARQFESDEAHLPASGSLSRRASDP